MSFTIVGSQQALNKITKTRTKFVREKEKKREKS